MLRQGLQHSSMTTGSLSRDELRTPAQYRNADALARAANGQGGAQGRTHQRALPRDGSACQNTYLMQCRPSVLIAKFVALCSELGTNFAI
jgi:hypothetical protein